MSDKFDDKGVIPGHPNLRPFKSGISGNPGGRPKHVKELLAKFKKDVPAARRFALWLLKNEDADHRARLEAAKLICLYGLGTPPKVPDGDESDKATTGLSLEELRALARSKMSTERGNGPGSSETN